MHDRWYVLHINPEPWAIGTISYKRMTPNAGLQAYQDAIRDEMSEAGSLPEGEYRLRFFFWRQQAKYLDTKDHIKQRHQADATNMQKALEDALQGILFDNDRNVRHVGSIIMAQGPEVEPCIVICASMFNEETDVIEWLRKLPDNVYFELMRGPVKPMSENRWRGPHV